MEHLNIRYWLEVLEQYLEPGYEKMSVKTILPMVGAREKITNLDLLSILFGYFFIYNFLSIINAFSSIYSREHVTIRMMLNNANELDHFFYIFSFHSYVSILM